MPDTPETLWQRHAARLARYESAAVNFDYQRLAELTPEAGWLHDAYQAELPAEAPGPPAADGSFRAAQTVLRRYSFPPPDLITGIFQPDGPLENRLMLLRARFLFFTFWLGVRVSGVVEQPGPPEAAWGYGYRTLAGHFEQGQIDFTVHKNWATGTVEARIRAVSRRGRIRNPFYWLGFKLFGRRLQVRFARESLRRLRTQVEEILAAGPTSGAGGR